MRRVEPRVRPCPSPHPAGRPTSGQGLTRRAGLAALALAGLTACAGTSRAESTPPATSTPSSEPGHIKHADLAYAEAVGRAHLLDLYVPTGVQGPFPVVLFQAGSAFGSDDTKSTTSDLSGTVGAENLAGLWAQHGYAVVGLNVRSSAQAKFPARCTT